jgi:hypothetical protein
LRSADIALQSQAVRKSSSYTVNANVTIRDEDGVPISGALVVGRWTRPDGSTFDANAWTSSKGVAALTMQGSRGLYTLTILNVVLSQYTFNPTKSVLSKSITVPAQDEILHPGMMGAVRETELTK